MGSGNSPRSPRRLLQRSPPTSSLPSLTVSPSEAPPPTPAETRSYWYPRLRGGITVIAGSLAYIAVGSAFGTAPSAWTALVGMLGSLAAMGCVWFLEARRAAAYAARQR